MRSVPWCVLRALPASPLALRPPDLALAHRRPGWRRARPRRSGRAIAPMRPLLAHVDSGIEGDVAHGERGVAQADGARALQAELAACAEGLVDADVAAAAQLRCRFVRWFAQAGCCCWIDLQGRAGWR